MSDERLKKGGGKLVYRGPIASVRMETFQYPDGSRTTRQVVVHPGAVCIIPHDGRVLYMVEQPREAVEEPALLELPAGKLDVEGETPPRGSAARARRGDRQVGRRLAGAEELLHESRVRQREGLALPGNGALRRSEPTLRRGADRDRRVPPRRDRSGDRPLRGRQVADRAAAAQGAWVSREGTGGSPAEVPRMATIAPPRTAKDGSALRSASRRWSSTSSLTSSSSGGSPATRSPPTAPTCSSSGAFSPSRDRDATSAERGRPLRLPGRAGAGRRRPPPCSTATVHRKAACLRSFYRHLRREEAIEDDPAARLEAPRRGRKLPRSSATRRSRSCSRSLAATSRPRSATAPCSS